MKDKKKEWVLGVMDTLEVPQETILDIPIISFIGNREIAIENFISIVEYDEDIIRLKTTCGELAIVGKHLEAKSMDSEQIQIKGQIQSVGYDQKG